MKTILNNLLELLRERVMKNIAIIRVNEQEIRNILKEPLSNQRTHNLNNRYALSKQILAENKENLEIQNKIVAYINNFKDNPEFTEHLYALNHFEEEVRKLQSKSTEPQNQTNETFDKSNKHSEIEPKEETKQNKSSQLQTPSYSENKIDDSIFGLTVKGELIFNKAHPHFNDVNFYNRLLNYHTEREEYEICAELVKAKEK